MGAAWRGRWWCCALAAAAGCSFGGNAVPIDADPNAPDADPNAPDADPNAPDADPNAPDAARPPDADPAAPDADPSAVVVLRYNLNGPEVIGVDYPGTWLADPGGLCVGTVWTAYLGDVLGTVDDVLFETNYFGLSSCSFGTGLVDGTYQVTMLFAENNRGAGCPQSADTQRIFDVSIEGVEVLPNFDVFAEGGGCVFSTGHPVARSFDVAVTGGTVDLTFNPDPDNAVLHAIRIRGPM